MRCLLFVFVLLLSATFVFAETNNVVLYDCHSDNNSTIGNITPEAALDEKDCTMFGSTSSEAYKECAKDVRKYNQYTLKLYQAGKCQKSGYRISGSYKDIKCSMSYDSAHIKSYFSQGSCSLSDTCFKNLAKEIKAKYPNIKGDSRYGFAADPNNVTKPTQPLTGPSATGKNCYYYKF